MVTFQNKRLWYLGCFIGHGSCRSPLSAEQNLRKTPCPKLQKTIRHLLSAISHLPLDARPVSSYHQPHAASDSLFRGWRTCP